MGNQFLLGNQVKLPDGSIGRVCGFNSERYVVMITKDPDGKRTNYDKFVTPEKNEVIEVYERDSEMVSIEELESLDKMDLILLIEYLRANIEGFHLNTDAYTENEAIDESYIILRQAYENVKSENLRKYAEGILNSDK